MGACQRCCPQERYSRADIPLTEAGWKIARCREVRLCAHPPGGLSQKGRVLRATRPFPLAKPLAGTTSLGVPSVRKAKSALPESPAQLLGLGKAATNASPPW